MRHSVLRYVAAVLAVSAGCTAAGSESGTHGPTFDGDGGSDATSPHDASVDGRPPPLDGAVDRTPPPPVDAGTSDATSPADAGIDAPVLVDAGVDAPVTCTTGTAALVSGSATALAAATFANGAWSNSTSVAGGTLSAPPAVAPLGNGFQAVVFEADGTIASFAVGGAASPTTVGTLKAREAPAIAPLGGKLHLLYQGAADFKFYHGVFDGQAWDAANDPVGGAGASQSFGPTGPAVTVVGLGQALDVAQGGMDLTLYDQTWNATWQPASAHPGTSVENTIRPAIVTLAPVGVPLIVYARPNDHHLMWTSPSGGTWSAPAEIYNQGGNVAFTNEPVALLPLVASRSALLVFHGTDGKAYWSRFDVGSWSAPAPIVAGNNPVLASPPALSGGVCGRFAMAAFVDAASGQVFTAGFSGNGWDPPVAVSGATGEKWVGLAAAP